MTRLARLLLFAWIALSAHALPSQRTGVTREDGAKWAWGYNDRGEVTSGGKKFAPTANQGPIHEPLLQFGYQYDGIGNRTQSTVASHTAKAYVEETTGANPPTDFKGIEDILWFTGMFAQRKVRMAEWDISEAGLKCPNCCYCWSCCC